MTEIRKIRKVGGSLTLTIPSEMGFVADDYIRFEKVGDTVSLTKVVLE